MNGSAKVDDLSGRLVLAAIRLRRAIAVACATAVNDLDGVWHLLETSDNTRAVRPSSRWLALLDRIEASIAPLTSATEQSESELQEFDLRVDRTCRRALLSAASFLTVEAQKLCEIDPDRADIDPTAAATRAERVATEILVHIERRTWPQFVERHDGSRPQQDVGSEGETSTTTREPKLRFSGDRGPARTVVTGWIDHLLLDPVGDLFSSNTIEARLRASDGTNQLSALTAACESYHHYLASAHRAVDKVQHLKVASKLEGLDVLILASCSGENPWPRHACTFSPRKEGYSTGQLSRTLLESPLYGTDQTVHTNGGHGDNGRDHELPRSSRNDAFKETVERFHEVVLRFALFQIGNRDVAEDITQETFIRAFRRFNSVDLEAQRLGNWLVSIAREVVREHVRSSRYRRRSA